MQVNTRVHEIAHQLLHSGPAGQQFSKEEREIQAESVAYVVCGILGLATKSPRYIALYPGAADEISKSLRLVSGIVRTISESILF